jgi:hypothetical protein
VSKPPESVIVGPYEYTIVFDELERLRRERAKQSRLAGLTDFNDLTIMVNEALDPAVQRETMLHEVLHTVFEATGASFEHDAIEEGLIRRISPTLLRVIRDNPQFVKYLQGKS